MGKSKKFVVITATDDSVWTIKLNRIRSMRKRTDGSNNLKYYIKYKGTSVFEIDINEETYKKINKLIAVNISNEKKVPTGKVIVEE